MTIFTKTRSVRNLSFGPLSLTWSSSSQPLDVQARIFSLHAGVVALSQGGYRVLLMVRRRMFEWETARGVFRSS